MRVLALDTSTFVASVAVCIDGAAVAAADATTSTHSEKLLPLIDALLGAAGLVPAALDAVACGAGPGSFTGLRIGLSTAKGICYALGKPLVMVSSLAALALAAGQAPDALTLALLDAKKHELYAGLYRGASPAAPEVVIAPDRLVDHVRAAAAGAPVVVIGDGAAAYPAVATACGEVLAGVRRTPGAVEVARLAVARLSCGGADDLTTAAPTYIRASEAEIALPPAPLRFPPPPR